MTERGALSRRFGALGAVLLLLASAPAVAQAQAAAPREPLAVAQEAYAQGRYEQTVALLQPLLYPSNRLATGEDYLSAHRMLGVSYVFARDRARAEQSFLAILVAQPSYQLDPLVDPPVAVELFEEVKRRNALLLREVAERERAQARTRARRERAAPEGSARALDPAGRYLRVERHALWINFLPFGAGQFQSGQRGKGLALLATQVALGGTSLGAALALRLRYPDSRPPPAELNRARTLNVLQVAAGGLFWAAAIAGVIDALVHHRREVVVGEAHPPSPAGALSRRGEAPMRRLPLLTGSPGGLGLQWTY
ncbi:MAG: hypothetical protein IPL40_04995 [Proteobacteria bacterium]|nr:hypothetical protein [Pseudomonadota bacterium]